MKRPLLLLVLASSAAFAQAPAPAPAPAPVGPELPVTTLTLSAPPDTLREYRLSEFSRLRYENVQLQVTGGTPEQAASFEAQIRAALRAREGEKTTQYKQFLKVLPGEGAARYLLNTMTLGSPTVSSRSLRTLGEGGGLVYQPEAAANAPADSLVAALLGQVSDELARSHAELLSGFDPASFGLLGTQENALTPGQTFTRLKTVQPPHPFVTLPGQKLLGSPLQVEQQLRFGGRRGDELVFSRSARVVQPGQIVTGSAELILTLARYVYGGSLTLTPDGLPSSAGRDEAYAVQVAGRVKQGELTATFSFNVLSTSVLTLTPVATTPPR